MSSFSVAGVFSFVGAGVGRGSSFFLAVVLDLLVTSDVEGFLARDEMVERFFAGGRGGALVGEVGERAMLVSFGL